MLKYLWKNKLLILILILIVTMCPITISLPEQSRTESIITAVGVDKKEDEYEVSIQYVVPQSSGGQENLKISKQKGKTVGEVFEKLNLELGKTLGFAHCRFIAFNEEAGKDSLTKILDYLLRQKTNTNNIVLILTKESAGDLLATAKGIDSDLYTFLSNSSNSNEFKEYNDLTTIGDFFRSYFGEGNSLAIYIVNTEKTAGEEGGASPTGGESSASSGSSGSSSTDSAGGETKEQIDNKERIAIIKDGKLLLSLDEEQSNDFVWFNEDVKRIIFQVNDYQDDRLGKVDTMVNIFKRFVRKKAYFDENGNPHMELNIKNYIRTSQIIADSLEQEDYEISQDHFKEDFLKKVEEEAIKKVKKAEQHFKENNYDAIECYETFYKFKNKQLKEYLKTHSKDDFIKQVTFHYNFTFVQGS